jgi:hypothetical protein
MISLDKQELQSIMLLKTNPDFKVFLDIIVRSITHLSILNASIKDDTLNKWNQGRIQELLDIQKVIKTCNEELHAFRAEARKHVE